MTNKERQKSLDKQKRILSEDYGYDLSGKLFYCDHCGQQTYKQNCKVCSATQSDRESGCLCATAYNRMVRKENKK